MIINMEKEKWISPELIIVINGSPEEAVLWACKSDVNQGPYITSCSIFMPTFSVCSAMADS